MEVAKTVPQPEQTVLRRRGVSGKDAGEEPENLAVEVACQVLGVFL